MALTLKQLTEICTEPSVMAPGAKDQLWWCPLCNFDGFGDVNTGLTDIDDYGLVATAHTFAGSNGFVKILDIQENTTKYAVEQQGADGFVNWKAKAEAMVKTFNKKFVGFINQEVYRKGIGLVELQNGNVMQIGTKDFPAYLAAISFDSLTKKSTEPFGFKFAIEATQPMILRYNYPTLAITLQS